MSNKSYDAIVIGSGMGGLTAGDLLAKEGLRVLLIEKEKQVGGYVVSFKGGGFTPLENPAIYGKDNISKASIPYRKGGVKAPSFLTGFTFDATGAFVGGCQEGGEFYQILKEIGVYEEIEFIPIHHIQNIYPGFEIHLQEGGFSSYTEALLSLFPEEEKGLRTYLSLIKRIGDEVRSYSDMIWVKKIFFPFCFKNLIRFHRTHHKTILDSLFRGGEIKMALHSLPVTEPPSKLSFLFVAILISKALMEGTFYPKGGMGRISEVIANSLLRFGGEICLKTEADQILIKDGRVKGILTRDGEIFQAPVVISNINPNLLTGMIPYEYQKPFVKRMRRFEYSLSCFILYIATDLDLKGRNLPYFTYLRSLSDLEEEDRMFRRGEVPKNPTMIISIPTLLDPSLAPTGQHLLKVLVTVPYHYRGGWGKENPERYHQIKEEFLQKVLQQLESKFIPGLRDHLLFCEAATPLTLERYTGNELGAMYGLASTPQQIGNLRPSHRTPISSLFQAGHYTRPSHGIVGASLSGLFAARAILKQLRL